MAYREGIAIGYNRILSDFSKCIIQVEVDR
jgi:hypothetical protein